jgi:hypothetical protein
MFDTFNRHLEKYFHFVRILLDDKNKKGFIEIRNNIYNYSIALDKLYLCLVL